MLLIGCSNTYNNANNHAAASVNTYNEAENCYEVINTTTKSIPRTFYNAKTNEIQETTENLYCVCVDLNSFFYVHYFILEEPEKTFSISEIETDFSVVDVIEVDSSNNMIKLKAISPGYTKVNVIASKYSAMTLNIYVE